MMKKNPDDLKLLFQELDDPYKQLNIAFLLISIIPVLALLYLLCDAFFGNSRLLSEAIPIILFTMMIMILGYVIGYRMIKAILKKAALYAAKAKRADELKSEFALSLAHDLKTPLAVVKANLFILKEEFAGPLLPKQDEAFHICNRVADRMDSMLMDLINTYKIEARMTELKIARLDLHTLIEHLQRECGALAAEKKIALTLEMAGKPMIINGDEDLIVRALNNLLGNAIKYTPANGRAAIKAHPAAGVVRIEFLNSGAPIPADRLEKIFDKFERQDSPLEGQGLGLAIARDIVERHHGKIWAASEPGKPNCFTVLLPLAEESK